ncbi:MAG: Membrane protein [Microgenomates group bacterium GW2011_GWC1_44_37]|nr:MAG: Membrane protein [Microgenomates group bacterium GW2011_GWC1_44_37]
MIKKKHIVFDFSIGSIFWVLFALAATYILMRLTNVIALLFIAILITLAVCPLVDYLEKYRINRALSSIVILLATFGTIIFAIVSLAAPLLDQTQLFLQKLPAIIDSVSPVKLADGSLNAQFVGVPGKVLTFALDTFSGFITAFTVIVISFYMIQDLHNLETHLKFWFGDKGHRYFVIAEKLEVQIGYWRHAGAYSQYRPYDRHHPSRFGWLFYLHRSWYRRPYCVSHSSAAGKQSYCPKDNATGSWAKSHHYHCCHHDRFSVRWPTPCHPGTAHSAQCPCHSRPHLTKQRHHHPRNRLNRAHPLAKDTQIIIF